MCLAVAVALCACAPASGDEAAASASSPSPSSAVAPRARVLVTVDYGTATVLDETVSLGAATTAMEALHAVADVGTAYGGGFVQSINGIGMPVQRRSDWFYAVNGVLSNRGATEHVLHDGDVEHWDYRQWGFRRNVTATLGSIPAFLLNGFRSQVRPTVVAFDAGFEAEAARIADMLLARGVVDAAVVDMAQLPGEWRERRNLIIIGKPDNVLVDEVFQRWDRLGLFTGLQDGHLRVYSALGDAVEFTGSAGLLQPLQNPWNPSGIGACENVVLLVSGTDAAAVRAASAALVGSLDAMAAWCGAVVHDGELLPVPFSPGSAMS